MEFYYKLVAQSSIDSIFRSRSYRACVLPSEKSASKIFVEIPKEVWWVNYPRDKIPAIAAPASVVVDEFRYWILILVGFSNRLLPGGHRQARYFWNIDAEAWFEREIFLDNPSTGSSSRREKKKEKKKKKKEASTCNTAVVSSRAY